MHLCSCAVSLLFLGRRQYCNWVFLFKFLFVLECNCMCNCMFAVPRPKPLSTVVHRVDKGNPVSRAVILSSTMDKVEELR